MPTNLKSLLTRSRSKNELKVKESKDEISCSSESSDSSAEGSGCKCESSGLHNCLKDACCCRHNGGTLCTINVPHKSGSSSHLHCGIESEGDIYPDLSYTANFRRDVSPEDRCFLPETFRKSLNSETATSTTMIPPPGSSYHHHHHHPQQHHHHIHPHHHPQQHQHHQQHRGCLTSQNLQSGHVPGPYHYTSPIYEPVPVSAPVTIGNSSGDYCVGDGGGGYYLDDKSSVPCTSSRRLVGGDHGGEMRTRNASCKTLFYSCSALHQHHQSCTSFESSHLDPTSDFSPTPCENHQHSSLTSGKVAAALPSTMMKVPTTSSRGGDSRTSSSVADGSMACGGSGSPSAAPCCTFSNAKDGCQSLSMRKCETVLALSNLNGTSVSTTTAPLTTNSSKSYSRNPASGAPTTAYSNFAASGAAVSHLSSSGVPSTSSNGNGNVGGKVRVMKEKIFSTSSSALNCLLHSSSRTGKLLSGWKLTSGSASSSSNGGSSTNVGHIPNMYSGSNDGSNCLGVNCQQSKHFMGNSSSSATQSDNNKLGSSVNNSSSARISNHHHHHKSRSQLSISENSFSSSPAPMTPVNRLRRNVSVNNTSSFCPTSGSLSAHSSYSRSSSLASFGWKEKEDPFEPTLLCRLCLCNVPLEETMEILACSCRYCKDCLISYVSFEIQQGAGEIACPDASCEKQGVMELLEVEHLVPSRLVEQHKKFRRFREVEKDSKLMWCPSPGCETVCEIQDNSMILKGGFVTETDRAHGAGGKEIVVTAGGSRNLPFISCPTCLNYYCAECKLSWHPDSSCESFRRKLIKQGKLSSEDDELFSLDSIKKCPFCHVPIEKDSGCAQMMCKRCKHVFCWYCLASLDDDFLLRHYDKGPCRNKLGHSRASVMWHRAQVIGIFAGFGVLVLLASPLLILAAPCLLCCRCRYCANKLDPEESDLV